MRLGATHLGYCTNVHPGDSLEEVRRNLANEVAAVRRELCPDAELGIGLWLSARAAAELRDVGRRHSLRALLEQLGLYVFTLNGFPFGAFHGRSVKTLVYEPDWRDARRLEYSNLLAEVLADLLPADADGSVSTLPCGFAPAIATREAVEQVVRNLLLHVAHLVRVRERTGKRIMLALEPEPCCFLETSDQVVAFFEQQLRAEQARKTLRELVGSGADQALQEHLGVCVDACHAAVEFERPVELVRALRAAQIPIGKLQLSNALRLPRVEPKSREQLQPFLDEVYLHQVVERRGDALVRYLDLPDALAALPHAHDEKDREWRIHFHVPVFLERPGAFDSTQGLLRELLALQREQSLCAHLEVETYTWQVLPSELRARPLPVSLARELRFCAQELGHALTGPR